MKVKRYQVLFCGVAASTIVLAQAASADSFTIVNGQAVGTTQILDTAGDVGTVEAGGTVDVPAGHGIEATVDGVTITNAGSVSAAAFGASGIYSEDGNTITNAGTVTGGDVGIRANDGNAIANSGTLTGGLFGIRAFHNNTITNTGEVTGGWSGIHAWDNNTIANSGTASGGLFGIYANDGSTITNSGMSSSADIGIGVDNSNTITNAGIAEGGLSGIRGLDNNIIVNSGTATGANFLSAGIQAGDGNTVINTGTAKGDYGIQADESNTIINAGDVTSIGSGLAGIAVIDNNTITNTGAITSIGASSSAIWLQNNNTITNAGAATGVRYGIRSGSFNTVTNTGTASGNIGIAASSSNTITNSGTIVGSASAVHLVGTGNTLNLLAGSNIQGMLALGTGNMLNIDIGLSSAFAYTGTPTINTFGLPSHDSGSVVYVVDPTGFSTADEMVADLTGVVAGALDERFTAARSGPVAVGDGAEGAGTVAWLTALGSHRDQKTDGLDAGFDNQIGGLMAGADGAIGEGWRGGLFIGAAASRMRTDRDSQAIDTGNYFAGGYAGFSGPGGFVDLSLTAGLSDFSSDRRVANNLAPGGFEHAEADYNGVFISPSVTFGRDFSMANGGVVTPSLRARYAGLFLGSYEESGSAANISVDNRTVNVFELRGQLAYGLAPWQAENGIFRATLRAGADGVFSDGGSIEAGIAGNPLDFAAIEGSDQNLRGFAGFDAAYATAGGAKFNVGTELGYDSNNAFTARAEIGFDMPL
ncbi:autotransporter domain-containing protein [Aminobacter sp. P9b]|uniref:autotransporter outer membrane beta-barrel domain-containing protein n=1 Tax=Aminobacter sp. P9b TaxID=3133697 RepID=UPI003251223F